MAAIMNFDEFFDLGATNGQLINEPPQFSYHGETDDLMYDGSALDFDVEMMLSVPGADLANLYGALQNADDFQRNGMDAQSFSLTHNNFMGAGSPSELLQWADAAQRPSRPCSHCFDSGTDCVVVQSVDTNCRDTCISCVTLRRDCTLAIVGSTRSTPSPWANAAPTRGSASTSLRTLSAEEARTPAKSPRSSPRPLPRGHRSDGCGRSSSRFSRETIGILQRWSSAHHSHPYPTEQEKDDLQHNTGLSKVQITNWLANARRRGLVKPRRSVSTPTREIIDSVELPLSQAPAAMSPMERWEMTLPENEAASVRDIASALTHPAVSTSQSPQHSCSRSENISVARASSTSSIGHSSGSAASTHSKQSHGSFGAFGRQGRRHRRQPRKAVITTKKTPTVAIRPYQCTFCPEAFKTKHDWQRHEKSLHLSLEKWICAPNGAIASYGNETLCAFCCLPIANEEHLRSHNYSSCFDRTLEERTFHRKDHLRQHLRLVHNKCNFIPQYMDSWKIESLRVLSRCGFCDIRLEDWSDRMDHLADHFKNGKTMRDWQGDWGFEAHVQDMVENVSLSKFRQKKGTTVEEIPTDDERLKVAIAKYDSIKHGLLSFINQQTRKGREVVAMELRATAYKLVQSSKLFANVETHGYSSWFKDMIACKDTQAWITAQGNDGKSNTSKVKDGSVRDGAKAADYCYFERALRDFAQSQAKSGVIPRDSALRIAACEIIMDFDGMNSNVGSHAESAWFSKLIMMGNSWLVAFRERWEIPLDDHPNDHEEMLQQILSMDQTYRSYQLLETSLAQYVRYELLCGFTPTDGDLRARARLIMFSTYEPKNQTAADSTDWLNRFKVTYGLKSEFSAEHPSLERSQHDFRQIERDNLLQPVSLNISDPEINFLNSATQSLESGSAMPSDEGPIDRTGFVPRAKTIPAGSSQWDTLKQTCGFVDNTQTIPTPFSRSGHFFRPSQDDWTGSATYCDSSGALKHSHLDHM